jgi:hypothetical protein
MMTPSLLTRVLLLGTLLMGLAACSDDGPPTTAPRDVAGEIFNTTRHLVLEGVQHDGFETVTVLAHLCRVDDSSCPGGTEEIAPVASRRLQPGIIHLANPDVYVDPPAVCLNSDMACRMSVVHCRFATRDDQLAAEYCVPSAETIAAGAPDPANSGTPHPCIQRRAERSHHIDYACITGVSPSP